MYGKRATVGRPYGRVVSRNDGEVAIEKIKKAPPQTAEPPAPLKGSHEGCHVCRPIRMRCVGEGEPLLEERCHGVTERWQSRK